MAPRVRVSEVTRLENRAARAPSSFTVVNLSEPCVRQLAEGKVPTWLKDVALFWTREHPRPSDTQDRFERSKLETARRLLHKIRLERDELLAERRRAIAYYARRT